MTEAELFELARQLDDAAEQCDREGPHLAQLAMQLRSTAAAIRDTLPDGGLPIHLVNAKAAGWPL